MVKPSWSSESPVPPCYPLQPASARVFAGRGLSNDDRNALLVFIGHS
jgi:hypothetical protein